MEEDDFTLNLPAIPLDHSPVTASGVVLNVNNLSTKITLDDEFFMDQCRQRTKNTDKCDLCDLRFRCYTSRDGEPTISTEYPFKP